MVVQERPRRLREHGVSIGFQVTPSTTTRILPGASTTILVDCLSQVHSHVEAIEGDPLLGISDPVVDGNYSGVETGSYDRPYSVLSDAINKAKSGGTVMLKTGSTTISTPQTLSKNIRIEAE